MHAAIKLLYHVCMDQQGLETILFVCVSVRVPVTDFLGSYSKLGKLVSRLSAQSNENTALLCLIDGKQLLVAYTSFAF